VRDITHVQGEELKDFVSAFELGAGIKLHGPTKRHKSFNGLWFILQHFLRAGNKALNDEAISE
jgi:hypothetical protein